MNDQPNFVLHQRSASHVWQGIGLLSIKMFMGGQALYRIQNGMFRVDDGAYLILNEGQPYQVIIDSETEAFCLFFERQFAASVAHSVTHSTDSLLSNPVPPTNTVPTFVQRTYRHDELISPILRQMRDNYLQQSPGALNEQFHWALQSMLLGRTTTRRESETLASMRRATREELYARLHLARDYMNAMYNTPDVSLDSVARQVALSPNHLLRTFKQLFGQTPHHYLTEVRLAQARKLLATTEQSITGICLDVGFESPTSFSSLFRRRFGIAPRDFRHQTR